MAAISIFPRRETTTTGASTSTINHDYTVTTDKRWLIGIIEVGCGTPASNNTVDIQHPTGTNIWDQFAPPFKVRIDPTSLYPRAIELESGDVLRLAFTRGTSTTVTSAVHIIESDI